MYILYIINKVENGKIEKELTTEEYIDYICGRFDEFVRANKRYVFGDGLKMILTPMIGDTEAYNYDNDIIIPSSVIFFILYALRVMFLMKANYLL